MTAEIFAKLEASKHDNAMSYLKAKFPETDEKIFFTDYTGQVHSEIVNFWAVAQAAEIDEVCTACNGTCTLKNKDSRPLISIAESPKGFSFLEVRWTCGLACKFQPLSGEFGQLFRKSGIKASCVHMTFKNYQRSESGDETRKAMIEAVNASKNGTCLIIAGKPGTGKTHLATAIAIQAMTQGKQAIFRLVSAMLDEIQSTINGKGDYDGLMKQFKNAPCLVLDDLGHENMTEARASYLHQIIDYRYSEKLQTIITTNARTPEELGTICGQEFTAPIISRILAHGSWVTIKNAPDFRTKRGVNNAR